MMCLEWKEMDEGNGCPELQQSIYAMFGKATIGGWTRQKEKMDEMQLKRN